jgi:hypothetical protein
VTAYDYDAAEPFHVLYMDQMSDDAVSNQLPNPHPCKAMQPFGLRLPKIGHIATTSRAKLMLFDGM